VFFSSFSYSYFNGFFSLFFPVTFDKRITMKI